MSSACLGEYLLSQGHHYHIHGTCNSKLFLRGKILNDEINLLYKQGYETKKYVVNNITIIQDTDWSYLQDTEKNTITLITCVENKPTQRRCIQGIEIKEEF